MIMDRAKAADILMGAGFEYLEDPASGRVVAIRDLVAFGLTDLGAQEDEIARLEALVKRYSLPSQRAARNKAQEALRRLARSETAIAAATGTAKTPQAVECEASQSVPKGSPR